MHVRVVHGGRVGCTWCVRVLVLLPSVLAVSSCDATSCPSRCVARLPAWLLQDLPYPGVHRILLHVADMGLHVAPPVAPAYLPHRCDQGRVAAVPRRRAVLRRPRALTAVSGRGGRALWHCLAQRVTCERRRGLEPRRRRRRRSSPQVWRDCADSASVQRRLSRGTRVSSLHCSACRLRPLPSAAAAR